MTSARVRRICIFTTAVYAASPHVALAHGQIAGIGEFYGGVLHPFYSPAHVVVVVVLGLFLGQNARALFRTSLPSFLIAAAVGLASTLIWPLPPLDQPLLLIVALTTACLVMSERSLEPWVSTVLFGASGLLIGLDSSVEGGTMGSTIKTLVGTWITLAYLMFMLGAALATLQKHWQRIGIRVGGSWVFAIALLVLAFQMKSS